MWRRRGLRLGLGLERRGGSLDRLALLAVASRRQPVDVLLRREVGEDRLEGLAVDRLLGDQLLRERIEPIAMHLESLGGSLERSIDDRANRLVDRLADLVGVVALLADLAAEEDQLVALPEGQRPEPIARAELRND